jgi:hypothetical protein
MLCYWATIFRPIILELLDSIYDLHYICKELTRAVGTK